MPKPHVLCRIRQVLDRKGLTQAALAEAARVEPAALSRIIRGTRNPRATAAVRLARALQVPVEWLWPDSPPKRHK